MSFVLSRETQDSDLEETYFHSGQCDLYIRKTLTKTEIWLVEGCLGLHLVTEDNVTKQENVTVKERPEPSENLEVARERILACF